MEENITNEVEFDNNNQNNEVRLILAGRLERLGASLIDGIISSIFVFIYMSKMGLLKKSFEQVPLSPTEQIYSTLFGLILFLIIQGYLLYKRGQTVGKLIVKIKIVDKMGKIPNFGRSYVLRYLVFQLISSISTLGTLIKGAEILSIVIPLIILADILVIFGPDHRCLHDYLAGTYVIKEQEAANYQRA